MMHGPCGGVRFDGSCEVGELLCPFVPAPVTTTTLAAAPVPLSLPARPLVLADIPAPALDVDALRRAAAGWAGVVDAALTGDHTATGHRPDAMPVFDLDSTQLASLAAQAGLTASVAATPLSPPTAARPARLAAKVAAGASVCIVNHTRSAEVVAEFVAAARAAGAVDTLFLACVPVVVSPASATSLQSFAGMVTPPGLLDQVLAADDPWTTGVAEAVTFAESILALPDVAGIDLSGVTIPGEEPTLARAMAEIARRLR